jgi:hypothetical protein
MDGYFKNALVLGAYLDTGLSDFGDDDWREPFEMLCKSLEEDADLTLWGRIRSRSEILILLENRLQIEKTYKDHPEIGDEEITKPLLGRSFRNVGSWIVIAPLLQYNAYMAAVDLEPACRYHKRFVKLLQ